MTNYINFVDADEIIAEMVPSSDPERQAWESLDESDKTVHITRAMMKIESLPYSGRADVDYQENQFPRRGQPAVPDPVKIALALEACAMAAYGGEESQRNRIKAQGIKSFSVGSLSETYDRTGGVTSLLSDVARYLLTPYMSGVVDCV